MILKALSITDHPILGHVDICWEPWELGADVLPDASPLLMLVGENGSGKTTLLTTLGVIFWDLFRRSSASFAYRLVYEVGGREVVIEAKERGAHFSTLFLQSKKAKGRSTERPLPNRLYAMTSGNERVWQVGDVDDETDDETRGRWLLLKRANQPLLTLAAILDLLRQPKRPFREVLDMAGLSHPRGFSLTFPRWDGPTHFRVSDIMDRLRRSARRCLATPNGEHLYFEVPDKPSIWASAILDGRPASVLVEELLALHAGDRMHLPLIEILFGGPVEHDQSWRRFSDLSDGERSFLGGMAMVALVQEKDALVLLDEPEVHYNDAWKARLVTLIHKLTARSGCQVVMTSHSSITLSDVPSQMVRVLRNIGPDGVFGEKPAIQTLAADPSDIMVQVFGTGNRTGDFAASSMDRIIADGSPKELEDLIDLLGPGYWRYCAQKKLASRQ